MRADVPAGSRGKTPSTHWTTQGELKNGSGLSFHPRDPGELSGGKSSSPESQDGTREVGRSL